MRLATWTGLPPLRARRRAKADWFYEGIQPLFDLLTEDSGFTNFGYSPTPATPLAQAQEALVDRVTAGLPPQGTWVDVGCGTGGPTCHLARRHPQVEIVGVNVSQAQLVRAWSRAARQGLVPRVRFREGDAARMPLPSGRATGLLSIEAAFHFPDKAAFAREALRVLEPGGRLAVADIVIRPSRRTALDRVVLGLGGPTLAISEIFTLEAWSHTLEVAGFQDIQVEDITGPTFGMLAEWTRRLKALRPVLLRTYSPLLLTFYEHSLDWVVRRGDSLPLGYAQVTAAAPGTPPR